MSLQTRFIEPLDILNFRGNKSFGEGGEHGESQMPPRPSIFAGALRSNWLAQEQINLQQFKGGKADMADLMKMQLGTPQDPGSFRLQSLWLARKNSVNEAGYEILMPLPADISVLTSGCYYLRPKVLPAELQSSAITEQHALLKAKAEKPQTGLWLTQTGLQKYLLGTALNDTDFLDSGELWSKDERLGIALSAQTRTAEEGRLYTTESIALKQGVGFVVGIAGADDLPRQGSLRLGGDGRSADMQVAAVEWPEPDWQQIEKTKRFRIVLSTPALFQEGWQLPGARENIIELADGEATLVCTAIPRHEVISGWDLTKWQPKADERLTPAGSVYWLENFTGSIASLQMLTQSGIGVDTLQASRRAEGFNNILIANWADTE